MKALELARKAAALGQQEAACRAYAVAVSDEENATPSEKLEAAVCILQFGGDYKISYNCFLDLYNAGHFQEDILPLMTAAFYEPNEALLRGRYERNCKLLEKYPYIFRRDFPAFEDLPIRFFPFDDHNGYVPFYRDTMLFGEYVNFGHEVVSRNFFKDLDKPILAADVYSQYELEYLNDNVRKSEYVGRENHVYLHYTDWAVFCAYLQVLNLRPLLKEEKLVFLIGDEIGQYPIDFKERFGIDYSQYSVKPIGLREINKLIWHTQLSAHNGGDFFNEIFDAHPNLLFLTSLMFDSVEREIARLRKTLNQTKRDGKAKREFLRQHNGEEGRALQELCNLQKPTDKDIFVAFYLTNGNVMRWLDPAARIVPAVFFQPHFHSVIYNLEMDEKNRTILDSEVYDLICKSPIFRGFKYVKTFTPMRRFTTSHGATVRFMNWYATLKAEQRREGTADKNEKIAVVIDAVNQRVLNRSYMIDSQERLYKDSIVVRLEDGKLNPKATFTTLAAFLDLPYTESMTRCTDNGKPLDYGGVLTDGFDLGPIYKTYDDFVNDSERKYIEYCLRDAYEFYGYDFHYYDGQPVTVEQVKEWANDFTTIDRYIRETWKEVYEDAKVHVNDPNTPEDEIKRKIQQQLLEKRVREFQTVREKNLELLMRDLRFINRSCQPLHMTPLLKPDPTLLENPIYH